MANSRAQRIMKALAPKWLADDMEADSRRWRIQCNTCGHDRSIWDIGGIRYKAVGKSRTIIRCPRCDRLRAHTIAKRE